MTTNRAESFLSNGKIFSLQTIFYTELEQLCCSPSARCTCLWNSSVQIKWHAFQKFAFLHQKCHGPRKLLVREPTRSTYLTSKIIHRQDQSWSRRSLITNLADSRCSGSPVFNSQTLTHKWATFATDLDGASSLALRWLYSHADCIVYGQKGVECGNAASLCKAFIFCSFAHTIFERAAKVECAQVVREENEE